MLEDGNNELENKGGDSSSDSGIRARKVLRPSPDGSTLSADEEPADPTLGESQRRCQAVFVRYENQASAMGARERMANKWKNFVNRVFCCERPAELDLSAIGEDDVEEGRAKQYRLAATRRQQNVNIFRRLYRHCCVGSRPGGLSSQKSLAVYLHWMFRVNFFFLFVISCIVFFGLTFIFAGFIILAGKMDPKCVRVGGEEFNSAGNSAFADAFALSWTTFSTVGYGSTYPALGHENNNPTNCAFITVLCSLESFIGVLYSGFCGAILFGKVLRIQSHAQVLFSDPVIVRFGSGVEDETGTADYGRGDGVLQKIPFPVLEFRIVNRLFNEVGGEIMDATINCVANIDANDVDPSLRDAVDPDRQRWLQRMEGTPASSSTFSTDHGSDSSSYIDSLQGSISTFGGIFGKGRDHQTVDEDPTSKLVSKRIFSKLLIEASEHPFFKRVWLARHVLDEASPLLTPRARKLIRRNKGSWPESLNNHQKVRESLQFNQILVSLNGVSNVSASDVYAQKIYDFVDISIGYQFVNLLYRDERGTLKVDTDLINDVREQDGGGGEPLLMEE